MNNQPTADDIRQQEPQQSPSATAFNQLHMSKEHDDERDRNQENDISSLKKRVNLWIALLPTLMFIAAAGGVAVAYYQLEIARTQFHHDQRPYVISTATPRQLLPNQLVMVNFRNGNYGKSPAVRTGGGGKVFFGVNAMEQADRWFSEEAPKLFSLRYETILPPNTPASHVEARWTTVVSDRPVTAEEFHALFKTNYSFVAVMRQVYLDSVGNEYWTDSCVSNLASISDEMVIVECNSHNEIH